MENEGDENDFDFDEMLEGDDGLDEFDEEEDGYFVPFENQDLDGPDVLHEGKVH